MKRVIKDKGKARIPYEINTNPLTVYRISTV
jgi:hypothetical protein